MRVSLASGGIALRGPWKRRPSTFDVAKLFHQRFFVALDPIKRVPACHPYQTIAIALRPPAALGGWQRDPKDCPA
jgi:hypothetical protein